jgi:ABC-type Fe3+-hydroxamate transport system substrate-binding protein
MALTLKQRLLIGVLAGLGVLCLAYFVFGLERIRRSEHVSPAHASGRPARRPPVGPRIVSLSPAISVIIHDLGRDPMIVGRDQNDMVLERQVPVCGDFQGLNYETILSLQPTHVLLQLAEVPAKLAGMAEDNRWTVANYSLLTLDDIERTTGELAQLVDVSAEPVVARMNAAWSRRDTDLAKAGRVLLLESVDPPAALGPGSFHQQILERIGGAPAITLGKVYITLDAEDILRMAPDAIILLSPRPPGSPAPAAPAGPEQVRAMLGRIGTLDIPAVKHGRMALIDDPLCLTPSTAMIEVADQMAQILERWATGP